jgi:transposase
MEVLYPRCCGLDVHRETLVACVRLQEQRRKRTDVRSFGTTTSEILELHRWLAENGCTHVAMESTGVFWQPVFNLLEGRFVVVLANAQHIKAVPGRKTDVKDCDWLADLLAHGLIRASFIPPPEIRALRELTRHRKSLIRDRARVLNRIHKLLETANIKLGTVVTHLDGVTGRAILKALVTGETDPVRLAALARGSLRSKKAQLSAALQGRFGANQRFLLEQLVAQLDHGATLITQCDARLLELAHPLASHLERLQTIAGIGRRSAEVIVSEIGVDMTRFASAAHLASWARVCPGTHESAGKRRPASAGLGNQWLRTALVESAWAASRARRTYLSAQYRRISRRRGAKRAALAIAHRLLVIAYHIIREEVPFADLGASYFDRLNATKAKRYHLQRLTELGCDVSRVSAAS